jgi:F-type H+-transporting ATPase subunit gamma
MASLKQIRRRIASVKSTQQITKAMKMVAAAKLRRAQENIIKARPYSLKLRDVIRDLAAYTEREQHPLLAVREPEKVAIMIVTADRGLCGSFNSNIIRRAVDVIKVEDTDDIRLINVGRRGHDFFRKRGYNIIQHHIELFRYLHFGNAASIGQSVTDLYIQQELDRVYLVYNEFKSAVQQRVIVEQLLPIIPEPPGEGFAYDFLFEPSPAAVLDGILPLYVNVQLWRVLLESNAAEQGARMTAMENATENADELIDDLTLHYNKARQAAITKELLEVVSGAEGLR